MLQGILKLMLIMPSLFSCFILHAYIVLCSVNGISWASYHAKRSHFDCILILHHSKYFKMDSSLKVTVAIQKIDALLFTQVDITWAAEKVIQVCRMQCVKHIPDSYISACRPGFALWRHLSDSLHSKTVAQPIRGPGSNCNFVCMHISGCSVPCLVFLGRFTFFSEVAGMNFSKS